jgi:hypothetical protein
MIIITIKYLQFKDLISTGVSEVGPVKPVEDFKDMLSRRDVDLVDKGTLIINELADQQSYRGDETQNTSTC